MHLVSPIPDWRWSSAAEKSDGDSCDNTRCREIKCLEDRSREILQQNVSPYLLELNVRSVSSCLLAFKVRHRDRDCTLHHYRRAGRVLVAHTRTPPSPFLCPIRTCRSRLCTRSASVRSSPSWPVGTSLWDTGHCPRMAGNNSDTCSWPRKWPLASGSYPCFLQFCTN